MRLYIVGFRIDKGGVAAAAAFEWPAWVVDADNDLVEHAQATPGSGARSTEAARKWACVGDVLEAPGRGWPEHQLTLHKWNKVRSAQDYRCVAEKGRLAGGSWRKKYGLRGREEERDTIQCREYPFV